jgi:hypothetical protein
VILHHTVDNTIDLEHFLVVFVDEFEKLLIDCLLKSIYLGHQSIGLLIDFMLVSLVCLGNTSRSVSNALLDFLIVIDRLFLLGTNSLYHFVEFGTHIFVFGHRLYLD